MVKLDPSLRLPAYRSTHTARFHPYPRGGFRRSQNVFTEPYVHVEERSPNSGPGPARPRLRAIRRPCAAVPEDVDISSFELDLPVVGAEYDDEELLGAGISTDLSQNKLALLLSDLLGALRRAFLEPTLRTVGGFKFGVTLVK